MSIRCVLVFALALLSMPAFAAGAQPSQIIQASDGTFWGVTGQYGKVSSGQFADGTVFHANLGLPPR